ncbi:MAG: 30S ribosomal protein S8 [Candidatus Nitrospinota bacterium M3_3B_026]
MSMSDPIADFLTRMRNAVMARHAKVTIPSSRIKAEMAALMRQEGYIRDFKIIQDGRQGQLRVYLKYDGDRPALSGLKRVSKPGLRVYAGADDIPTVRNGLGAAVISTNKGIMSDREAREAHVGGEVLCYIW